MCLKLQNHCQMWPCKYHICLSAVCITVLFHIQETEIDRFQAPEEAAAEEDKLRVEREDKEKQQIKVTA